MGRSCAKGRELEPPDPHGSVPFPGPPATKIHLGGVSILREPHRCSTSTARGGCQVDCHVIILTLLIPKMLLQFGSGTKPL